MFHIKRVSAAVALASVLLSSLSSCSGDGYEFAALYRDLPFEMPRLHRPSIPSYSVDLVDFGAVNDGITLNTEAFRAAMEHLKENGGGHLNVGPGIWKTGPVRLESNTDLHLEEGAIIIFSHDRDLYPVIDTNFEGLDTRRCLSPLSALGAHDISITGKGIIDGGGWEWRELKRQNASPRLWKRRVSTGGVTDEKGWYPDEGYLKARQTAGGLNEPDWNLVNEEEIKSFLRPVMVSLRECTDVLLEGCTFRNSPCWNLHPLYCRNVIIKDIHVLNPSYSTNGDGIDIDACENVILSGTTFDVGDDAICIKSGKDEDGRRHAKACRNLIIDGCTVYSGHGGFVIGSEMSGGVNNIKVSNCRFLGTETGLRFKSKRGRGGVVEDIWMESVYMDDIIGEAVTFNLYYAAKSSLEKGPAVKADLKPVDETTPVFRNMHFRDIRCSSAQKAIYVNGLPEMPVTGLEFRDCIFSAREGIEINHSGDITLDNVTVHGAGPMQTEDSFNIIVK